MSDGNGVQMLVENGVGTLTEATEAPAAPVANGKVNLSAAVREAFGELGSKATNDDVRSFVHTRYNTTADIAPSLISKFRSAINAGAAPKTPRAAKVPSGNVKTVDAARPPVHQVKSPVLPPAVSNGIPVFTPQQTVTLMSAVRVFGSIDGLIQAATALEDATYALNQ